MPIKQSIRSEQAHLEWVIWKIESVFLSVFFLTSNYGGNQDTPEPFGVNLHQRGGGVYTRTPNSHADCPVWPAHRRGCATSRAS